VTAGMTDPAREPDFSAALEMTSGASVLAEMTSRVLVVPPEASPQQSALLSFRPEPRLSGPPSCRSDRSPGSAVHPLVTPAEAQAQQSALLSFRPEPRLSGPPSCHCDRSPGSAVRPLVTPTEAQARQSSLCHSDRSPGSAVSPLSFRPERPAGTRSGGIRLRTGKTTQQPISAMNHAGYPIRKE
jgi:hypothetical protein